MVVGLEGPQASLALAKGELGWGDMFGQYQWGILMWLQPLLHIITALGHSGVGMASCCVNSVCSVSGRPGLGYTVNESVLQHWVLEEPGWWKQKTGVKCTKSEIRVWKILSLIRGCKFLSDGLIPFLLMPFQHESPFVRNRPDNWAHTITNTT